MKITCDIISDLLPLYIDNVCTEDTKLAVAEHIEKCRNCSELLTDMTAENPIDIPEKTEAAKARKPFKKLKMRFIFWLVFGIFCSCVICTMLYYAGVFDDIEHNFTRSASCIIENAEPSDQWATVEEYLYFDGYINNKMAENDYLEIRGLFPRKKLYCSFPDIWSAEIRIIDEDGNVVVEPMEVQGGMMDISLKGLKRNTKYYLQYRTETGGNFAFNFH